MKIVSYLVCAVALLLSAAEQSFACRCVKQPAAGDLTPYAAVFSGEVRIIKKQGGGRAVIFSVEQLWKGALGSEVVMYEGNSSCDVRFKQGTRYLVYAMNQTEDARLRTHACTRTNRLENATDDLNALGASNQPLASRDETLDAALEAWTLDRIEHAGALGQSLLLSRVALGHHRKLDRIGFQFAGDDKAVPGYTVEYAAPPFIADGSGETVAVKGAAFLRVRLQPAQAHTDAGRIKVLDAIRRARTPAVTEIRRVSDFEGQIEYVIGLKKPQRRFRVFTLTHPARLVIDIEHERR